MGQSQTTDYTSTLHFVQNLTDENFGEVDIFRNEEGKFIMKCAKSFLTGDKRHGDFKRVLEFMRTTNNKNVLPLLYLEQHHESNVCIEYQKVFVFTEYLNFTLKGLIVNKKIIDEAEMWYLIKSMVELIQELQRNDLKMVFSVENIFLTLKGIPSVFLYHFICNEKSNSFENDCMSDGSVHADGKQHFDHQYEEYQKQSASLQQITYRPQSMHFSLAKTMMQLINMELINPRQNQSELQTVKSNLFLVNKKNKNLGRITKLLLIGATPSQILSQIQLLQQENSINVSSQIRFNKFRYVVESEEKTKKVQKDLSLNDKNLMDFKSRPQTAVNTPIYRLRQDDSSESMRREFSVKNKLIGPEQNFFKKKSNNINNQQLQISHLQSKSQQLQQQKQNKEERQNPKTSSISKKQNSSSLTCKARTSNPHKQSKLSLISKRNLSTSKSEQGNECSDAENSLSQSTKKHSNQENITDQKIQHHIDPKSLKFSTNLHPNHQSFIEGKDDSCEKKQSNKTTLRASNRIKEILNEEMSKSRQFQKTYAKLNPHNKTTLLSKKLNDLQNLPTTKTQVSKSFFKPEIQKLQKQPINRTEQDQEEERSILYKPFLTEQHLQEDNHQIKQQKIRDLFGESNQNFSNVPTKQRPQSSSKMKESVNALDRSNFLSTLEIKKFENTQKVKNISEKKDLILSDLRKNQAPIKNELIQDKRCLRNYFSQKSSQPQTLKNSTNPTTRALNQIDLSANSTNFRHGNVSSEFEKKKVKVKADKPETNKNLEQNSLRNKENMKVNKENFALNLEDKLMANSKLRRLSLRSKAQ